MSFESPKILKKGTWREDAPKKPAEEPKSEQPLDDSTDNVKRFRWTLEGKIEEVPWGSDAEKEKKAA